MSLIFQGTSSIYSDGNESFNQKSFHNLGSFRERYNISSVRLRRFRLIKFFKQAVALLFTQLGLFCLVTGYTIGGAFLFQRLEQRTYYERLFDNINKLKATEMLMLKKSWLLESLINEKNKDYSPLIQRKNFHIGQIYTKTNMVFELRKLEGNFTRENLSLMISEIEGDIERTQDLNDTFAFGNIVMKHLRDRIHIIDQLKENIYEAVQSGWKYESDVKHYLSLLKEFKNGSIEKFFAHTQVMCADKSVDCQTDEIKSTVWSLSQSLLFTITVITTIGYGNLVPKTVAGKLTAIFYAIFGIPLMLLCLANLGNFMADVVKLSYKLSCFRFSSEHKASMKRRQGQKKTDSHSKSEEESVTGSIQNESTTDDDKQLAVIMEENEMNNENQTPPENAAVASTNAEPGSGDFKPILRRNHHARDIRRKNLRRPNRNSSYIMRAYMKHHGEVNSNHEINVPNWLTLLILVGYLMTGAVVYSYQESWTLSDSIYFIFITLSTIGFGDLVPGDTEDNMRTSIQIFALLYLIIGLAMVAMCFNLMQENVTAKVKRLAKKIGLID